MIKINRVKPKDAHHALAAINLLLPQLSPSGKATTLTLKELKECLYNKNFYLFVAEDTSESHILVILGMGSIFFQRNTGGWIAEIHDVVVDKNERDRGFGSKINTRLIKEAENFSRLHQKPIKLYLTSRPSRVIANKMYIKQGFVLVAKAKDEWGTNLYKMVIRP